MHLFKFFLLFSVLAASPPTFAGQADNKNTAPIQSKAIALSPINLPTASAKAYSEQYRCEQNHKITEAKLQAEANAAKKSEAKSIASPTTRAISLKILRHWQAPPDSNGKKAHARIILTPSGSIQNISISDAQNQAFKDSIEECNIRFRTV